VPYSTKVEQPRRVASATLQNPATTKPPAAALDLDPVIAPSLPPDSRPRHRPALTADGRVKILVAEDDRLSREMLERHITGFGYDVVLAHEGGKALTTLLQADGPRLALLDWEMPGLSGIDVCRVLRGRKDAPYVYVILCTSRDGHRQLINGLAAGADDYIRKPFDAQELEVRLRAGRRVVLLQDELLETKAELERRALYDSLTNIKNRGAILDVARRELSRGRRSGKSLSVALGDLDHFKHVNDTYGHPAGDQVLREFVRRIGLGVRAHDDVGRYGGEEFFVVLPECSSEAAMRVAQRLGELVSRTPVSTPEGNIPVTASFGIAATDQGYDDLDALIQAADEALYAAKNSGRNRAMLAANRADRKEPIRPGS